VGGDRRGRDETFGFMPFYPGRDRRTLHPLDPFYLSWKAKQYGFESRFIELAAW